MACWLWEAKEKKKEKKEMKGNGNAGEMQEMFSVACLCRSDGEYTSDRDKISEGDSLPCGEHFYKVGFSIPLLDFSVKVGVCFS